MIKIENLTFRYNRKQTLFNQLNLELPAGNIYGLLGKNGAAYTYAAQKGASTAEIELLETGMQHFHLWLRKQLEPHLPPVQR